MSAIAMGAIAAAGAVIGIMNERSSATAELEQFGRHMAAVEADAARQQQNLVGQTAAVMEMKQQKNITIEKNAMAAQSDAAVAAAAAGSSGQSVEMTSQQIEENAGAALGASEKMFQNQLRGIEQKSRDINFDADAQIYDYTARDPQGDLSRVFLSGMQGFFGAQGFGT